MYSNVVGVPLAALVKDNWVHPLEISSEAKSRVPEDVLAEGITTLDGKLYGFPLFSLRQYTAVTWFNVDHFAKAGLDPNKPPVTYDEFRTACQALKPAGIVPMTLALGPTEDACEMRWTTWPRPEAFSGTRADVQNR